MNKWDPKDMTAEERLMRVIELLAKAAVQPELGTHDILDDRPQQSGHSALPKSGPVPFGEKVGDNGLIVNEEETFWIRRIQELAGQDLSMEKIAKHLNAEDHETRRQGKWCGSTVWRLLRRESKKGIAD